jgi:hypothetical protein
MREYVSNRATIGDGVPDGLVASQWFDRLAPDVSDVPERRLLFAVLVDAIRCLQAGSGQEQEDVANWIRGENGPARLSFRTVCEGLNFEAVALARRVLQLTGTDKRVGRRRLGARATRMTPHADIHS